LAIFSSTSGWKGLLGGTLKRPYCTARGQSLVLLTLKKPGSTAGRIESFWLWFLICSAIIRLK
jgi:hypothetical protein